MTDHDSQLMSIGAFSQATRLSVRMLRHYAKHGFLQPAYVDPHTGYRSYAASQLADGMLVRTLRDLGLPIAAIATAIRHQDDADSQTAILTAHLKQLHAEQSTVTHQLNATRIVLAQLKEPTMSITTSIENHDALTVIALRDTLATYPEEKRLWEQLMPLMGQAGVIPTGPGGVTYLDNEFKESDIDAEIWVPVAQADVEIAAPAVVKSVPATKAVVATVHGPYDELPKAFGVAATYREEQGLQESGKPYMRYVADPSCTPDPANYITEVCLPVR